MSLVSLTSRRRRRGPRPAAAPHRRRGAALAVALACLVLIGLVAAGGFASSQQAYRGGRNALVEQRAFAVAEFGLNQQMANWDTKMNLPPAAGGFPVGAVSDSAVWVARGDTARVRVTRLGPMIYWIESIGRASIPSPLLQAARDVSALVRLAYPTIKPKGAVTVGGDIDVGGNATIDGRDAIPYAGTAAAWDPAKCNTIMGPDLPAIVAPPGASVSYKAKNVPSLPAVTYDPAAADSNTYVRFGTESWKSLAANAQQLPGGVYGTDIVPSVGADGKCNTLDAGNWGEPFRGGGTVSQCAGYFPIIYLNGSSQLNGKGRGQGILLVNGDLKINGTFDWVGLIIVRDDIDKGNGSANITGAVMARNVSLFDGGSTFNGTQDVQYSKCAVESALRGSAVLQPVRERSWAQLF
jgi:hypothetical protein